MVTRERYLAVWNARRTELMLPWEAANPTRAGRRKRSGIVADRWSSFWARYLLNQPDLYRRLVGTVAWELIIPLRLPDNRYTLTCDGQSSQATAVDILLYPTAVTVVARIDLTGPWTAAELAAEVWAVRTSDDWSVTGALEGSRRSLDGIAHDIAAQTAPGLGDVEKRRSLSVTAQTVAALLAIRGPFELDDNQSSVAGLASMQPSDNYDSGRLLEVNGHTSHASRIYDDGSGHVIWYPGALATASLVRRVECLHRNHTELVGHIAALATIVSWASRQIADRKPIPVAAQPLIQRAAQRLDQLYVGDPATTYRSSVAELRIEPFRKDLDAVMSIF